MSIFLNIVILIIGVYILIKSADFFVDSASTIARKMKISPLIIGLTIVALGTSLPELAVSITASLSTKGTADLAMGNIVGSSIANMTLVFGVGLFIAPVLVHKKVIKRDGFFLFLSTGLLVIFGLFFQKNRVIDWWEALILLSVCLIYLIVLIKTSKELVGKEPTVMNDNTKPYTKWTVFLLFIGIIGIALGAEMVTRPAQYLAEKTAVGFGLDKSLATTLVGLTIVAVGTSLPELATAISAAKKKQNDIVLGNVIGSCILNILFIVGITGIIKPLGINKAIATDLIILIGITSIFIIFMIKKSMSKIEGVILVSIYIAYLAFVIFRTFTS